MAKTSKEKIDKMIELVAQGKSAGSIAKELEMGESTVRDNIKRLGLKYMYSDKKARAFKKKLERQKYLQSLKSYEINFTGSITINEDQLKEIIEHTESPELMNIVFDTLSKDEAFKKLVESEIEETLSKMIRRDRLYLEDILSIDKFDGVVQIN